MAIVNYQYRVDGGTPVDAGMDFTENVLGLSPVSTDFEMRSEGPVGVFSAWSPVISATPLPALFDPLDLANLLWYIEGDQIAGYSDNDDATLVQDLSPANRDFAEATNPPKYRTGANGINSLPALVFDGTNDRLLGPDMADTWSAMTIAYVYSGFTHTARQSLAGIKDNFGTQTFSLDINSPDLRVSVYPDSFVDVASYTLPTSGIVVAQYDLPGDNIKFWHNGVKKADAASTLPASKNRSVPTLGELEFGAVSAGKVAMYWATDSIVSEAIIGDFFTDYMTKYGF